MPKKWQHLSREDKYLTLILSAFESVFGIGAWIGILVTILAVWYFGYVMLRAALVDGFSFLWFILFVPCLIANAVVAWAIFVMVKNLRAK